MNYILDLGVLVILALTIYNSVRKGFARSVIELAGYFASLFVSYALSAPLGKWIYTTFLVPFVNKTVTTNIAKSISKSAGATANVAISQAQLDKYLSSVPESMRSFLSHYGISTDALSSAAQGAVTQSSQTVAQTIVEKIVLPITYEVGAAIAFAIIFFLCMVVVRFLARAVGRVFRLPVLRTFDRLGGAAIGLLKGLVLVYLAATVIAILVPLLAFSQKPAIYQSDIDSSTIFRIFYDNNPVTQVLLKK